MVIKSLVRPRSWQILRGWYRENGRHGLPWRHERTPWSIFVAESVLRRTNATISSKLFPELIKRFPSPHKVVEHPEIWRNAVWSAGIHSRANLFIRSCQTIVDHHDGMVPKEKKELLELPGVGHYTASAVRCFGFGAQDVLVDTNTIRIAGRVSGHDIKQANHRGKEARETVARLSLDGMGLQPEDNFALLDLAAIICRPTQPKCTLCPLKSDCAFGRTRTYEEAGNQTRR